MKKTKCLALITRARQQKQKRNEKIALMVGKAIYSTFLLLAFLSLAFLVMGIDSLSDLIIK